MTLTIDDGILAAARRYADEHDTSVSRVVETYRQFWSKEPEARPIPPPIAALVGIIKDADAEDYERYLIEKYK